jgi:hypothetical protein
VLAGFAALEPDFTAAFAASSVTLPFEWIKNMITIHFTEVFKADKESMTDVKMKALLEITNMKEQGAAGDRPCEP